MIVNKQQITFYENYRILTTDTDYGLDSRTYMNSILPSLQNKDLSKVLLLGLGLGVIPEYLTRYYKSDITIVERDNYLIETLKDVLDTSITYYNIDALTFTPSTNYSLIIADIWWGSTTSSSIEKQIIDNRYKAFGEIVYPIIK